MFSCTERSKTAPSSPHLNNEVDDCNQKTYRRAGQRCFGLLALISRPQVRYIHLPERMILPGSLIPSDKYILKNLTFVACIHSCGYVTALVKSFTFFFSPWSNNFFSPWSNNFLSYCTQQPSLAVLKKKEILMAARLDDLKVCANNLFCFCANRHFSCN